MGVLPALILGLSTLLIISRSLSNEITTKNQILATSLSDEVEIFLKEPLSLLGQIDNVLSADNILSYGAANEYLQSVIGNYMFFDMIQYLDNTGKVIHVAPFSQDYIDTDMSRQVFFKKTINTQNPTWSKTFISMQSGQPTLTLSIPAARGGILVGYINLQYLTSMVQKFSNEHSYAIITDQEGTIIAEALGNRVQHRVDLRNLEPVRLGLSGKFGTYRVVDKGEDNILSIVSLPLTNWLIMYFQHYDNAFSPVIKIKEMLIFGALATALLAFLIALLGARLTFSQLTILMSNAKKIAAGDYSTFPTSPRFREFQELDQNFRSMAQAIEEREDTLKESERIHRNLVEAVPYGIQEFDVNGTVTYTNRAFEKILEHSRGEVIGKPIWHFEVTKEKKLEIEEFLADIVKKQPHPSTYFRQVRTAKNNLIDIQVDWQYKYSPEGELLGFINIITDITEKKLLEGNLRQAQKMEAIGTLAGGIAHDFNNILAAILGYSELVLDDLPSNSQEYRNQKQVIKACHRARDLVQHLLIFSRKQEHNKTPIELHQIIEEALKLLRATIPSTIHINQIINHDCGVVEANSTQIHQVILNLCTNAAHAMQKQGGILEIKLEKVHLNDGDLPIHADSKPGEFAKITISDTGEGIPQDNLERIFDPFFTTKKTGEGTGMGLAVVHGIVMSHSGFINVESTPGKGTVFTLFFPSIASAAQKHDEDHEVFLGSGEHILVVDDEQAIVEYTRNMLNRIGYTTSVSTDSAGALKMFMTQPDKIDLVLTDQTMPEVTGIEMARKMLIIRPDLPVILCTGYSPAVSAKEAKLEGITEFVMKPLDRQTLSQKIARALGKTTPVTQNSLK